MTLTLSIAHADTLDNEPCDLVQTLQQFAAPIGQLMGGIAHAVQQLFPRRPFRINGVIAVGDKHFSFVSGGAGWSIPYGTHQITPDDVGSWGARHGAMGLDHDDCMYDKQLHRCREGIELHPAHGDRTEGCVGIKANWSAFKKAVLAMINDAGSAFLHIGPTGAAITPAKASPLPVNYVADAKGPTDVAVPVADRDLGRDDHPVRHRHLALTHRHHHHVRTARHRHYRYANVEWYR